MSSFDVKPASNNSDRVGDAEGPEERKHFSIDLSLELERQLEMEGSPPSTPNGPGPSTHRESLDPHVLSHIITQLRKSLEDITRERDDLVKLLESATSREASLQDTLQLMTEKAAIYEEELSAARKKMKDDEEAIVMLRNKVEESRRGLMRLQSENRRQSMNPNSLDTRGIPGIGSSSSKRASFTPLTGRTNGHRKVSSISTLDGFGLAALHPPEINTSPNSQAVPLPEANSGSRRSLFGRSSPPSSETPLPSPNPSSFTEAELLKKEIVFLKKELQDIRVELAEANEAKEASDSCVKALREFIAENQVGATPGPLKEASALTLPQLQPSTSQEGLDGEKSPSMTASSSGWGFKLWKAETARPSTSSAATTHLPNSSPPSSFSASQQAPASNTPSVVLSRTFGGFFSSRASVNSLTSTSSLMPSQSDGAIPTPAVPHDSLKDTASGHSIPTSFSGASS